MVRKLVDVLEGGFLLSFWLQTRIDLSRLWPSLSVAPVVSDYLIPFVYLSDILFALFFITWMVSQIIDYRLAIKQSGFKLVSLVQQLGVGLKWPMIWFGALVAVSALSLWINVEGWWGWWKWIKLVEGGVMIWVISWRLRETEVAQRWGLYLLIGLGLESVLLLGEWLKQSSLNLQWIGEWRFNVQTPGVAKVVIHGQEWLRPMATFAHPNIAGGVLALALPIGALFWKRYFDSDRGLSKRFLRAIQVAWLGLGFLALLVTFSRTAWVTVAVVSVWCGSWQAKQLWLLWRPRFTSYLQNWRAVVAGIGAIMAGALIVPLVIGRFLSLATTDELSYERRVQLTSVALDLWRHNLWWGVGLNSFVIKLATYGPLYGIGIWRQPVHDYWLLIGVETGLLGLLCLLFFFAQLLWPLIKVWLAKEKRHDLYVHYLIGVWIGWLLLGMADHYWWTSQQGMLITWLLCGASLAMNWRLQLQGES